MSYNTTITTPFSFPMSIHTHARTHWHDIRYPGSSMYIYIYIYKGKVPKITCTYPSFFGPNSNSSGHVELSWGWVGGWKGSDPLSPWRKLTPIRAPVPGWIAFQWARDFSLSLISTGFCVCSNFSTGVTFERRENLDCLDLSRKLIEVGAHIKLSYYLRA